jgi:hypothetical protein
MSTRTRGHYATGPPLHPRLLSCDNTWAVPKRLMGKNPFPKSLKNICSCHALAHLLAASSSLREVFLRTRDLVLHADQDLGLPLVQPAHLVVVEQAVGEGILITSLHGRLEVGHEHIFARAGECRVHAGVVFQGLLHSHQVTSGQMANTGLQKVIFDAVLHQVVVNSHRCNFLKVLNGFVVIALESCNVCSVSQSMLVSQFFHRDLECTSKFSTISKKRYYIKGGWGEIGIGYLHFEPELICQAVHLTYSCQPCP